MKELTKLSCKDYIEYDSLGLAKRIYCKVCGDNIAYRDSEGLKRRHNYAEMKILKRSLPKCYHVTNICATCMDVAVKDREMLRQLVYADLLALGLHEREDLQCGPRPRGVGGDKSKSGML